MSEREQRVDEGVDHPDLAELAGPDLLQLDPVAEGRQRARVEHHVAGLGLLLGVGQRVHQRAREHVDELDARVADHEAVHLADRHRDLDAEPDRDAARGLDDPDPGHHLLHGQAQAVARLPSSASIQAVTASPLK